MKKIILTLLLASGLALATEYKVVFNLTSGNDEKVTKHLIKNIERLTEYYNNKGDTLKTAVVISGNSYKYFRNDLKTALDVKFQTLAFSAVEFKVCSKGLEKRKIPLSALDKYVIPAFNQTAALIEYQNAGYADIDVK